MGGFNLIISASVRSLGGRSRLLGSVAIPEPVLCKVHRLGAVVGTGGGELGLCHVVREKASSGSFQLLIGQLAIGAVVSAGRVDRALVLHHGFLPNGCS